MNEYLLYPGILLIVFLTDRLIVSRVIIREAKKWILFFASVICIFGTLLLDGYWSHLAGFTMGAVFISAYFIIRNNEYLKQEMTMMKLQMSYIKQKNRTNVLAFVSEMCYNYISR